MKNFVLLPTVLFSLLLTASHANGAENFVLKCSSDERASDGLLQELVITQTPAGSHQYSLLVEGSAMGDAFKNEAKVEISNCGFSKKTPGIGACSEVTPDGFRGKNRLSIVLAFIEGRDQILVTNYVTEENSDEVLSLVSSFDVASCVTTL